jgi:hypothetical protein
MSDPWEDEGFGGEDDWESGESLESDVEDEDELDLELEGLEDDELESDLEDDDTDDLGL